MSHQWGVVLGGTGLLGSGWWRETVPSTLSWWPMVFPTRTQARAEAKRLTEKFAYLDPVLHGWKFWAVKVLFTIEGREK